MQPVNKSAQKNRLFVILARTADELWSVSDLRNHSRPFAAVRAGLRSFTHTQVPTSRSPLYELRPLRFPPKTGPIPTPMQDNTTSLTAPAAIVGFDWGEFRHAIALQAPGKPIELVEFDHSPENVLNWAHSLFERFGGAYVDIAIEATRGAVVYCLMAFPWIRLFPIHPTTSSKQRTAFRPSGAKDDTHDAIVLLDILRTQRDRIQPQLLDDTSTRLLAELTSERRKAVDLRSLFSNQLTSALRDYFPQALQLFGENPTAPLALAFLTKWPTLIDIQASSDTTIANFYTRHNVRSMQLVQSRIDLVRKSRCMTQDEAIVTARSIRVKTLIQVIKTFQRNIEQINDKIQEVFHAHPDRPIFRELPGAGEALAPRLVAAFGSERERYPDAESVQKALGVAPVTESSGRSRRVHWRRGAPRFHRQTLVEWAGQTVMFSAWAKAYYEQQKGKGAGRQSALRSLAFKWIRIVWKCWKERVCYSEKHYLAQLEKRGSPIAKRAKEIALEMGILEPKKV